MLNVSALLAVRKPALRLETAVYVWEEGGFDYC